MSHVFTLEKKKKAATKKIKHEINLICGARLENHDLGQKFQYQITISHTVNRTVSFTLYNLQLFKDTCTVLKMQFFLQKPP